MKKLILFAAILFAGVSVANAQQNAKPDYQRKGHKSVKQGLSEPASTNLTVQLNSIQSISVNTSNVSLVYTTVKDYENGVKSGVIEDHLQVYSTGGYKVNVGYSGTTDTNKDKNSVGGLDAKQMFESINVAVTKKGGAFANVSDTKLRELSINNGAIISSNKGVFGETFDVEYQGAAATYINSIKDGATRTYTADVVYTITAS